MYCRKNHYEWINYLSAAFSTIIFTSFCVKPVSDEIVSKDIATHEFFMIIIFDK